MTHTDDPDSDLSIAIARHLYGLLPTAAIRLGSAGNAIYRIEFGGLRAKVVKISASVTRGEREQHVLSVLRQPRYARAVPGIEFTQLELPRRLAAERIITVLRNEPGMTLADAILRGERWTGDAMRAGGAFAASAVPAVSVLPNARRRESADHAQHSIAALRTADGRFDEPLARVAEMKQTPADRLIHGEFIPQNVLCDGDGICVVDWETARPGWCISDLAQLTASLVQLNIRDADVAELRRRAADGFFARRPDDLESDWIAWETYWLQRARNEAQP